MIPGHMYFSRYFSQTPVFLSVFFVDTCIFVSGDFEHPVHLSVFSRTREFLSALFLDIYIYLLWCGRIIKNNYKKFMDKKGNKKYTCGR